MNLLHTLATIYFYILCISAIAILLTFNKKNTFSIHSLLKVSIITITAYAALENYNNPQIDIKLFLITLAPAIIPMQLLSIDTKENKTNLNLLASKTTTITSLIMAVLACFSAYDLTMSIIMSSVV